MGRESLRGRGRGLGLGVGFWESVSFGGWFLGGRSHLGVGFMGVGPIWGRFLGVGPIWRSVLGGRSYLGVGSLGVIL